MADAKGPTVVGLVDDKLARLNGRTPRPPSLWM